MENILSFKTVILALISLIFIKIFLSYVNKENKKKVPPSPLALPFIGHLHLLKKPLHHTLTRISNHHGPATLLRFGSRRVLVISSRALAEQCFTTHDLAFANRPQIPSIMLPDMIGMANYGAHWRNCRQIAQEEIFSTQRIQASSEKRAAEVRNMVHQLFDSCKMSNQNSNGSNHYADMDLRALLFELMINMIMMMMAGKRLSSAKVEDMEDMKQYREVIEDWFELSVTKVEDFSPLLSMLDLSGVMKKMRHATDVIEAMVQKLIEEHRQGGVGKRNTMIGQMLQLQQKNPDKYSDFVIRNILIVSYGCFTLKKYFRLFVKPNIAVFFNNSLSLQYLSLQYCFFIFGGKYFTKLGNRKIKYNKLVFVLELNQRNLK
jgi:isoflavone/4'-methoxyisoflavone 2'-hydroxylase